MRRHLRIAVAISGMVFSASALSSEVFSCTIAKNNKFLQLTETNKGISYSYGRKRAKPELAMTVAKQDVELYAWDGFGRYHNYFLTIPNGAYKYQVFSSYDTHHQRTTLGVSVYKGDSILAELECKPETVKGDLDVYVENLKEALAS